MVIEQFAELIRKEGYKMPRLIRTDKGKETELLKILALRLGCVCARYRTQPYRAHSRDILPRSPMAAATHCRTHFSRGKSTQNTRVERMWVEVNKITWKYKLLSQV